MLFVPKKPLKISIINLNERQQALKDELKKSIKQDKKGLCQLTSCLKSKKDKKQSDNVVYVLDFTGDIKASDSQQLREEITAILSFAKAGDEVVIRLDSSGGQVHSYGLAAAQLERLKATNLHLTVCVDKVAASGGYMMACVADQIITAPFAIIGSIGVVSQMPNFYEFLKKHDIDVELFTAGEYKRTVTMFGENSDDDRAKYQEELERIHTLFKDHVKKHRPNLDIDNVATGEFWLGVDAQTLGLVDTLGTSDSYLLDKMKTHTVLVLHSQKKPSLMEKIGFLEADGAMSQLASFAKEGLTFGANKLAKRLPL